MFNATAAAERPVRSGSVKTGHGDPHGSHSPLSADLARSIALTAVEALVEDAGAITAVLNPEGRYLYANEAASRTLGTWPQSAVGTRIDDAFTPEVGRERSHQFRLAAERRQVTRVAGMLRGVWYLTTFRPVPESGTAGGPAGLTLEIIRPAPLPEPGEEASAITHGHDGYQLLKHHDLGPLGTLTTKELLILRLIGLGFTTANIAKEIDRSVKTIEWYRVSLGEKFNVANRVELAGVAIRAGLVYLDEKTVASLRAAEDRDPGVRVHALRKRTGPPARRGRKPKSAE